MSPALALFASLAFVPAQDNDYRAINRLNSFRKAAGLEFVAQDPILSKACVAHAKYLSRNIPDPYAPRVNLLTEDPKRPGHTQEGQQIGGSALVGVDRLECIDLIDSAMASVAFRLRLLDPTLKRVGM